MSAIAILGIFVADTAYRATRAPRMGETVLGSDFALGPGGKGSNQAVAAARLGAEVTFISKIGRDTFGDMAMATWAEAGVTSAVSRTSETYTGAAYIFIEDATGDNAIIVCPGVAGTISAEDVEAAGDAIRQASVFVTQLEQPIPAALRALQIAKEAGATTILNPAPAATLDDGILTLCDYVTPNETEAEALTGMPVTTLEEARTAARVLRSRGVGAAIVTLGERGALLHDAGQSTLVPACDVGPVVETTGAGDAFNGGFATALARGFAPLDAVRFGCAVAGISVTRPGSASSMPRLDEAQAVFAS